MRNPRTFTWKSVRPRYSSSPFASARRRTRSIARYIRPPGAPNGHGRKRSAVIAGRFAYPRASPSPARYSSPTAPTGTGCSCPSSTYACELASGVPISTCSAPRATSEYVE